MARRIPSSSEGNPWVHPVLTLSLLVAWIVASMAILATLCASCHRKASPSKPPSRSPSGNNGSVSKAETTNTANQEQQQQQQQEEEEQEETAVPIEEEEEKITELDAAIRGPIYAKALPSTTSKRRLSMSLSMGIPEGLSKIKTLKKERHGKGGGAAEDTIWKKTIILGEKCRLPSEEDDEGEENAQQKSHRLPSEEDDEEEENAQQKSHGPKTPRSLPASRRSSFISSHQGEPSAS